MTIEALFHTIPTSGLSEETISYLYANAISLKMRCQALLAFIPNVRAAMEQEKTPIYELLCQMVSILANLLIKDQGVEEFRDANSPTATQHGAIPMDNALVIYCVKPKKERQNIEKYRALVELLNRQSAQSGGEQELRVLGLFEAKKGFRCENFDPYDPTAPSM